MLWTIGAGNQSHRRNPRNAQYRIHQRMIFRPQPRHFGFQRARIPRANAKPRSDPPV